MTMFIAHPDLDELAAFAAETLSSVRRGRLARHLLRCARCQDDLRFMRRLDTTAGAVPSPALPPDLARRVQASRDAGARVILPTQDANWRHVSRRRAAAFGLAATAVLAVLAGMLIRAGTLSAANVDSALHIAPEHPTPGAMLHVTYRPGAGLFADADSLVLRARLRTERDDSYNWGVPASQTRSVAVLYPTKEGAFEGSFALPVGIVFASLAVEDPAANRVDDHQGRLWEVLTYAPDDRPSFAALEQRSNDLMGRSWEEAYATARELCELYPDRVNAWTSREFFERALYGEAADSISAGYQPRIAALIAKAKSRTDLSEDEIGTIFYRAWVKVDFRKGATGADSAELAYWWARMNREYPRHPQVAQRLSSGLRASPQTTLDSLDILYARLAPLSGPGQNMLLAGRYAAERAKDDDAYRRWTERSARGELDSLQQVGLVLALRPGFRDDGIAMLRSVLRGPPEGLVPVRMLEWNAARYQRALRSARARVLGTLGRALIASGARDAGLDTLRLAAGMAWNVGVFRAAAAAYLDAGDTAAALDMEVRVAIDPRTAPGTADSLAADGRFRLGVGWDSAAAAARRELHASLLERSTVRQLRGVARLEGSDGERHTLRDLLGHQAGAVIFWTRHCGAAIQALPNIVEVAGRLKAAGTPVVLVVDESPSSGVDAYLEERHWTLPIYHDVKGSTTTAFANFGTPAYYVLDSAGRIRFDWVNGEAELVAQVEAVSGNEAGSSP